MEFENRLYAIVEIVDGSGFVSFFSFDVYFQISYLGPKNTYLIGVITCGTGTIVFGYVWYEYSNMQNDDLFSPKYYSLSILSIVRKE